MSFENVKEWCLQRVGEGYIYGAKGQTCSLVFRQQQANQYPAQAKMILGTGAKWDGKPVWDCAQLTRFAAKQGGVSLVSGATSQWRKTDWRRKGEIAELPQGEISFLYREKNGTMQHTGVYLGDGTFVHAKGTAYGVLHENLGAYEWTHWAIPEWQPENGAQEDETMEALYGVTVSAGSLNLRREASTGSDRIGVFPRGTALTVYEESADGEWLYVKATIDDKRYVGWVKAEFVQKLSSGLTGAPDEDEEETQNESDTRVSDPEELVSLTLPRYIAEAFYERLAACVDGVVVKEITGK